MAAAVTASKAYKEVVSAVEKIKNDDHAAIATMSAGDVLRQGDIYIVALDKPIPYGQISHSRQLAPGDTQGSRHVAEGDCEIFLVGEHKAIATLNRLIPATKGQQLFIGPMIHARGDVRITHPEHGDRTIPGDCSYLVTYQKAFAETVRRQAD